MWGVACMVHCSGQVWMFGGLHIPFIMLSRVHIRLATQYCVTSVECIIIRIHLHWNYVNLNTLLQLLFTTVCMMPFLLFEFEKKLFEWWRACWTYQWAGQRESDTRWLSSWWRWWENQLNRRRPGTGIASWKKDFITPNSDFSGPDAEQENVPGKTRILSHPGVNPFLLFTIFNISLIIRSLMYVSHRIWFKERAAIFSQWEPFDVPNSDASETWRDHPQVLGIHQMGSQLRGHVNHPQMCAVTL